MGTVRVDILMAMCGSTIDRVFGRRSFPCRDLSASGGGEQLRNTTAELPALRIAEAGGGEHVEHDPWLGKVGDGFGKVGVCLTVGQEAADLRYHPVEVEPVPPGHQLVVGSRDIEQRDTSARTYHSMEFGEERREAHQVSQGKSADRSVNRASGDREGEEIALYSVMIGFGGCEHAIAQIDADRVLSELLERNAEVAGSRREVQDHRSVLQPKRLECLLPPANIHSEGHDPIHQIVARGNRVEHLSNGLSLFVAFGQLIGRCLHHRLRLGAEQPIRMIRDYRRCLPRRARWIQVVSDQPVQPDDVPLAVPQILFVCTANICRSPAAEAIARDRFGEQRFRFRSAGFLEKGRIFEPDMAKAVAKLGVNISGDHESSVIDTEMLHASSLVLTMEARHVQNIVIEADAVFDRVIPLKEAAELIDERRIGSLEGLLAAMVDRDPMRYLDRRWDVEDPYKRSRRHYKRSAAEIVDLVNRVIGSI